MTCSAPSGFSEEGELGSTEDGGSSDVRNSEGGEDDRNAVEKELAEIWEAINSEDFRTFVNNIKSGSWFPELLSSALRTYALKATPEFFANKYPGLPPDAVVDRQVELAQRYAAICGGVTQAAYVAAISATIGTQGGSSPVAVPAAFTAIAVDMLYLTKLQLRLAYDMSVLYGKPADIDDPEDLYELLSVAFGIKATEFVQGAINKAVPEVTRQGVKAVAKGSTLVWLKELPLIGKYLLQRNIIKFAFLVGVPIAIGMNYWSTGAVASAARQIYRDKALATEKAKDLLGILPDHELLISVVWAATRADGSTRAEEMWLLKDMVIFADEAAGGEGKGFDLGVDVDIESLCAKAAALGQDDRNNLFEAACLAMTIDRKVPKKEKEFLENLAEATKVDWDSGRLKQMIRANKV